MDGSQFPIAQHVQLWTSAISYVAATGVAAGAFFQYSRSKKLERAKWMLQFYEKFYEQPRYKRMREILDCGESSRAGVEQIVRAQEAEFTDYLNLFEFVSYLGQTGQLDKPDIEALFGYYLDCLERLEPVRRYIFDEDNGLQFLAEVLASQPAEHSTSVK